MTGPGLVALAAAFVVVLSFAMLRAAGLAASVSLLRWHLAATATAVSAAAFGASPARAAILLAGAAILLGLAARIGVVLARLDRRTGSTVARPAPIASLPLLGIGLALTSLAVFTVSALAQQSGRQATALGLAATLLGLLSASRQGSPALCLGRLASAADGLVLLACASSAPLASMGASLLLTPTVLLVAALTIGRAGGLP